MDESQFLLLLPVYIFLTISEKVAEDDLCEFEHYMTYLRRRLLLNLVTIFETQ